MGILREILTDYIYQKMEENMEENMEEREYTPTGAKIIYTKSGETPQPPQVIGQIEHTELIINNLIDEIGKLEERLERILRPVEAKEESEKKEVRQLVYLAETIHCQNDGLEKLVWRVMDIMGRLEI